MVDTAIHVWSAGGFAVTSANPTLTVLTVITDVCAYGVSIRRIDSTSTTVLGVGLIVGTRCLGTVTGLGTTNPVDALTLIATLSAVSVVCGSNSATVPTGEPTLVCGSVTVVVDGIAVRFGVYVVRRVRDDGFTEEVIVDAGAGTHPQTGVTGAISRLSIDVAWHTRTVVIVETVAVVVVVDVVGTHIGCVVTSGGRFVAD